MDPASTPEDKSQHKPVARTCVTFDEGHHYDVENEPNSKSPNQWKSISSSSQLGVHHTPIRGHETPSENHSALTVSAEVLKLNEQIARVRQQLTSLCSTDPSPSPGGEGQSCPRPRSSHLQLESYDALESPKDQETSAGRSKSSTPYRESSEQERASGRSSKRQDNTQARRKRVLNWTNMGGALLNKSTLKHDREACSHESPFRTRKEKTAIRPSARDSLGTSKFRTNVSKKLRVRVPSVASSQSDGVCTHCRRHMSDEENGNALHYSIPDMSNHPSPKVQTNRTHCIREPKHWNRSNNGGMDSSTASEEKEEAHHSLHNCRKKLKPHGLPELVGWSDESDESHRHGSSLIRQGASLHSSSHLAQRKPWYKTRDNRGAVQQDKGVQRPQVAKDEPQVRKGSGPPSRKKVAIGANSNKVARKEKAFPANLRESIHSHHPGFMPQKLAL
jgi:hypothetical protein